MRRYVLLASTLTLAGCAGFGDFLEHTFSGFDKNPNAIIVDSVNFRRVTGRGTEEPPLVPEPGNIWPGVPPPDPTLSDLERQQNGRTGQPPAPATPSPYPPPAVPTPTPALPPGQRQPRGSSTPPVAGTQPRLPQGIPTAPPVQSTTGDAPPPRDPTGTTVITPNGPTTDTGGNSRYRTLNGPGGRGVLVPNGNGTSTLIGPDGSVQTVPNTR